MGAANLVETSDVLVASTAHCGTFWAQNIFVHCHIPTEVGLSH